MLSRISSKRASIYGAVAVVLASVGATRGSVIIYDTFTGTNGTPIAGRTPNTIDVPGTTYLANGGAQFTNSISGNRAQLGVDEGDGIATDISTPSVYTISDLFNDGNIGGSDQGDRGEGLGFFSSLATGQNGVHGDGNFTGIAVSPAGLVSLISVTASQSITVYSSYSVPGYSSSVDHTLSYTADTGTGLIGNVLLDGNAIPLAPAAGLFTPTDTEYAGFTASANALGESATYTNFSVAVPEPASAGFFIAASGAMLLRRRWQSARVS